MIPFADGLLLELLDRMPTDHPASGLALASAEGDAVAQALLRDVLEEDGLLKSPLEIGKSYLVCQVTLYYVGRVVEVGFGFVRLEQASWVHWTGRLSELLKVQNFKKVKSRTPRLEYCGDVILFTHAAVSAYPWLGPLPEESIE